MTHLSDDDIQAYLDGGRADPAVGKHLGECKRCSDILRSYRILYAGLADRTAFPATGRLAVRVASRLGLGRPVGRRWLPAEVVLSASGILAAVAVTLIFLDMGPFVEAAARIRLELLEYAFPALESTGGYGGGLRPLLTVAVWGLAIVIAVAALDRCLSPRMWREAGR